MRASCQPRASLAARPSPTTTPALPPYGRGGRACPRTRLLPRWTPYGVARATALADAGQYVSVVNPARVQYAGRMRGRGNQTDQADARLLAACAARNARPPGSRPRRKPRNYKPRAPPRRPAELAARRDAAPPPA